MSFNYVCFLHINCLDVCEKVTHILSLSVSYLLTSKTFWCTPDFALKYRPWPFITNTFKLCQNDWIHLLTVLRLLLLSFSAQTSWRNSDGSHTLRELSSADGILDLIQYLRTDMRPVHCYCAIFVALQCCDNFVQALSSFNLLQTFLTSAS